MTDKGGCGDFRYTLKIMANRYTVTQMHCIHYRRRGGINLRPLRWFYVLILRGVRTGQLTKQECRYALLMRGGGGSR